MNEKDILELESEKFDSYHDFVEKSIQFCGNVIIKKDNNGKPIKAKSILGYCENGITHWNKS